MVIGDFYLGTLEYKDYTYNFYYYREDREVTVSGKYDFYLEVECDESATPYAADVYARIYCKGTHTQDDEYANAQPWVRLTKSDCIKIYSEDGTDYYGKGYHENSRDRSLSHGTMVDIYSDDLYQNIYYDLDGTRKIKISVDFATGVKFIDEEGNYHFPYQGTSSVNFEQSFIIELPPKERKTSIVTATNFTDEDNPTINYKFETEHENSKLVSVDACISFDGFNDDIKYRAIPTDGTSYTFNLTDEERDVLRSKSKDSGSSNVPIYFMTKTLRTNGKEYKEFIDTVGRTLTIVGSTPILNPTVRDVNSDTIALTGNENIFVRYESMVEFATGATASKYAEIVSQSVQCGSTIIKDMYNGVIDNIEDKSFIFNATDSRGLHADQVVVSNSAMIEYVKPTCNVDTEIDLTGETGATIKLKVSGNYYNGSFGAVNNSFGLIVEYQSEDKTEYDFYVLTTANFNGNTYECSLDITGLDYKKVYNINFTLKDKLNTVITDTKTVKLLPVFDWSETDFNFNVPINLNGNTVLRHNQEANNTVLSATGGHIYLRPAGTDNTTGETIIYPDGKVKFGGAVDFSSFTIGGKEVADYVIESGEASMGSNGTWYWHKWASGKAECWGCRNFGNMAVTTAWGSLYRSAYLTQDLPEDVFKTTPDVININIVNGNFGGWICKHENLAPSAVTTGSFIYVRPASATVTPTYIGFHVIGVWKQ